MLGVAARRANVWAKTHKVAGHIRSQIWRCLVQHKSSHSESLAVVTGASGCIGNAIATHLARSGCKTIVHYAHNRQDASDVVGAIRAAGGDAVSIQADLRDRNQVIQLFTQAHAAFPNAQLDVCVNNAGIIRDALALKMAPADWEDVISLDLSAVFYCSQVAFSHMLKHQKGRIINISSVVGQIGNPGQANYAAAKGGVIALTRSLAKEFAKRNICVNTVCPGFIESTMTTQSTLREDIIKQIPLNRLGKPDEVAGLVRFLALDPAAAYMTGHSFNIDGGVAIGAT